MSFYLEIFTPEPNEPEHQQYAGRIAIVLPWQADYNKPQSSRYCIITPWTAETFNWNIKDVSPSHTCNGNTIFFYNSAWGRSIRIDTDGMVKFNQTRPIPPPVSRWNRYGERKTFEWSGLSGRWIQSGWEKREEE